MVQIILGAITLGVVGLVTFLIYRSRVSEVKEISYEDSLTIDSLSELVMTELAELVRDDGIDSIKGKNFEAEYRNKKLLSESIDKCIHGIKAAREVVIAQIRYIIEREITDLDTAYGILDLREITYLHPNLQWEVLCYFVSKKRGYKNKVMKYLNDTYRFEDEKPTINPTTKGTLYRRIVDSTELISIVEKEVPKEFTYEQLIDIISLLVFQRTYGFRCVDTIRRMDIDGFNMGTSGSIRYIIDGNRAAEYTTLNSVWVQINAKWVHLSFLEFSSEDEMKRVVNQLTAWGTAAPMTEKKPYKVNDAFDGSRVTTIRPPSGESWAAFVRKFTKGLYIKEKLLNKPNIHNWELPAQLIYFLMRAERTLPFTGQQNTGKTSMMKACMVDTKMVNIRVLEMSFELALRELYPYMNVLTVKPTDYVSASMLQDLLKKMDGYLSMVGEVAEDKVAARMIQFCLIASAFTIFSHHAKDDYSLINGLANSLVACGEYEDHDVATSTVLDAIKHNVHLDFVNNERVIAYISEIVKLDEIQAYPEFGKSKNQIEAIDNLRKLNKEYYTRRTDRVRFTSRKIIKFNPKTMTYETNELYSPEMLRQIIDKLDTEDRKKFIEFYKKNWAKQLEAEEKKAKATA